MTSPMFERFRPIDTDTHLTEPADVWTSRMPSKWGDDIPHVKRIDGRDVWIMAGQPTTGPGFFSMAGFDGSFPECPATFEDVSPASYDAKARLEHMDREGIRAQVLYPNVGGFGSGAFLRLEQPELMLDCVRAYNDFLSEWTDTDPDRLVPVMALPFWDVQAAVAEVERCAEQGHKAVLMSGAPQDFGEPYLSEEHWDPLWATAQDAGLSISFHIGSGEVGNAFQPHLSPRANFARYSSLSFVQNANSLTDVIFGGVCHRFPRLKFVSVESGVGWMQSFIEGMDWQWTNGQVQRDHPEYDLLPSEYFRRQIYGCFWFEQQGLRTVLENLPDNLLWETDFPHPTCQHPGPANAWAQRPSQYAEKAFADVSEETLQKVLHDNAAALYGIP